VWGEILEGYLGPAAEDNGPLDHIGQLAYIAGPGIGQEACLHLRRDGPEGLLRLGGKALEEKVRQRRDIVPAVA
jgi:hypothetical protein